MEKMCKYCGKIGNAERQSGQDVKEGKRGTKISNDPTTGARLRYAVREAEVTAGSGKILEGGGELGAPGPARLPDERHRVGQEDGRGQDEALARVQDGIAGATAVRVRLEPEKDCVSDAARKAWKTKGSRFPSFPPLLGISQRRRGRQHCLTRGLCPGRRPRTPGI